jgi:hypothetical protein
MVTAYPDIPVAEPIAARDQQGAIRTKKKKITRLSLDFACELENHQTSLRSWNTSRIQLRAEKSADFI